MAPWPPIPTPMLISISCSYAYAHADVKFWHWTRNLTFRDGRLRNDVKMCARNVPIKRTFWKRPRERSGKGQILLGGSRQEFLGVARWFPAFVSRISCKLRTLTRVSSLNTQDNCSPGPCLDTALLRSRAYRTSIDDFVGCLGHQGRHLACAHTTNSSDMIRTLGWQQCETGHPSAICLRGEVRLNAICHILYA